jgi:protein O-GlcNAc transferase
MYSRGAACLVAAVTLVGCAAHRSTAAREAPVPLEAFIAKVRQLTLEARPTRQNDAGTLERSDPALAAAQLLLAAAPTGENHRLVAEAYARLGVRDTAFDHFTAALHLNPRDAAALDGLARVWRDWGFPQRALGHAYRAIAFAPAAAGPRNTLGTLLVSLGQPAAARSAFERALALDPGAAYVLNNLCYALLLEGDTAGAVARCRAALDADPSLHAARNNLALSLATAGDFIAASREFLQAGDAAAERYNMGIAFAATHRYADAALAFDAAAVLRPSFTLARQRAQQARDLALR